MKCTVSVLVRNTGGVQSGDSIPPKQTPHQCRWTFSSPNLHRHRRSHKSHFRPIEVIAETTKTRLSPTLDVPSPMPTGRLSLHPVWPHRYLPRPRLCYRHQGSWIHLGIHHLQQTFKKCNRPLTLMQLPEGPTVPSLWPWQGYYLHPMTCW